MTASFEAIDLDNNRIARVAVDTNQRRGTRRAAWPAGARFEAYRSLAGGYETLTEVGNVDCKSLQTVYHHWKHLAVFQFP